MPSRLAHTTVLLAGHGSYEQHRRETGGAGKSDISRHGYGRCTAAMNDPCWKPPFSLKRMLRL